MIVKREYTKGTDDIRINSGDGSELKYWSAKFGVSKADIKAAVNEVGSSLTAVMVYFKSREP
nr:DUF3606 domain-containing protein [Pseudomonas poae]